MLYTLPRGFRPLLRKPPGPSATFYPTSSPQDWLCCDLELLLTGPWNATEDGSTFLHCFTCSKWNHMLDGTASLLSVIGRACTAKAKAGRGRHNWQAFPPTTTTTPLSSNRPRLGVPHSGPGQVEGHRAEPEIIYWSGTTCQIQFNSMTVSCVPATLSSAYS